MRLASLFLLVPVFTFILGCQDENLSFKERIQPVPKDSGFKMDDYWIWGGSMIEVDGKFHLFASRWKKDHRFPENYRNDSEIVRAISDNPLGSFEFEELVIGERDSSFWDSNMAHNPTILKIDDEFVLFYIGSDFTTIRENSNYLLRRVGYASSRSIEGPWKRSEEPLIDVESNNPAVLVDTERVLLIYRDAPLRIFIAQAQNYKGPYELKNDNVWPEHKLEDFYLFKINDNYHLICEDNIGGISNHVRWGVQLYSENGIDKWKPFDPPVVYDHDLIYSDGDTLHCNRRERPQLLINDNKITHLLTGIYDGKNSWCQPVALEPPLPLN